MTTTIELAAKLIVVFEGFRSSAYQDSGGVWTIGFGHTEGVKQGDVCTIEQATAWLSKDANPLLQLVEKIPVLAGAAYVSFGYNCGYHALQLVLQGAAMLSHFVHDRHGNVLPGLVARRNLESALIEA